MEVKWNNGAESQEYFEHLKEQKKKTGNEAKIHHNTDNGQKRKNDNNTETTMLRFAFQTIQLLCCLFLFRMEEQADIFLNLLKV